MTQLGWKEWPPSTVAVSSSPMDMTAAPAASGAANPNRAGSRPTIGASAMLTSAIGMMFRPASTVESLHSVVRNSTKLNRSPKKARGVEARRQGEQGERAVAQQVEAQHGIRDPSAAGHECRSQQ